ncbi:MAG: hypothetical protein AB7U45_00650 [Desulfamplus sp.]
MKKAISLVVFALAVLIMPSGLFAQEKTVTTVDKVTTTETVGTISEFNPDTIVVRTETSSDPINYTYTKSTTYVDEDGKTVSMETVKSGQPVTIYYTKDGDRMTADKVVIRKTTTTTK